MKVILSVEALEPRLSGIGRYSWELAQRIGDAPEVDGVRFYRNGEWIADPTKLLEEPVTPKQRHKVHRWLRKRTTGLRKWGRDMRDASSCGRICSMGLIISCRRQPRGRHHRP
ncbi:hypothetical protein ACFSUK_07785 [Sphingobium scionense]